MEKVEVASVELNEPLYLFSRYSGQQSTDVMRGRGRRVDRELDRAGHAESGQDVPRIRIQRFVMTDEVISNSTRLRQSGLGRPVEVGQRPVTDVTQI